MIILDTNIVSELMPPAPAMEVRRWLAGLGSEVLATTAVTVAEVTFGLHRLPSGARRSDLDARFAALVGGPGGLAVLAIDDSVARLAGGYLTQRQARGKPSTMSDMLIAGVAGALGAPLATRNGSDFEGLPIALVNPWA